MFRGASSTMRNRAFRLDTIEVVGPVVLALGVGLLLYVALVPRVSGGPNSDAQKVRIYTSVPMNKFASIVHGVEMAISEANSQAGSFHVELVPLNDAKTIDG